MSLINVSESGPTLRKSGGCSGCPDASAVSEQQLSGSGMLQVTATETGTLRFIGLSPSGVGTQPSDLGLALRLQSGVAEVREYGAYKSETPFSSGDTFRIVVDNGVVKYSKNGAVFYTSSGAGSPGRAHVIFYDLNATLSDISIGSLSAAASSAGAATSAPGPASASSSAAGALAVPTRPRGRP
jgi:hypothetical protein